MESATTVGQWAKESYHAQFTGLQVIHVEGLRECSVIRYGRWRDTASEDSTELVLLPYTCNSDYSGSLVESANRKWIEDSFGEKSGVYQVYGGYGTAGIAVVSSFADSDLIEALESLESYPLICDQIHSELEMESQERALDSWALQEFLECLEKHFEIELDSSLASSDGLRELFHQCCESANEYWVNEQGDESYINVERLVSNGDINPHEIPWIASDM
tara:strand:+ start:763 stop:1416 length:654 start_codon:yes stop_codon:yes gene_type:complete